MVLRDPMPLSAAADALGVTPERVRALIAAGELPAVRIGSRWIVERSAVDARQRAAVSAGRPWSLRAAWGAVALLEGQKAPWLGPRMRARITRRLAAGDVQPSDLRRRAHRVPFRVHPALVSRLLSDRAVVVSGLRAAVDAGLDLVGAAADDPVSSGHPAAELYVRAGDLDALVARHRLLPDAPDPNAIVRVVSEIWPFAKGARMAPGVAVALDLLESDDGRARRAAQAYFARRLAAWST